MAALAIFKSWIDMAIGNNASPNARAYGYVN